MVNNLKIQLEEIKHTLTLTEDNFIGVFLYGSQNYSLNNEQSDSDAIMLIQEADRQHQEFTTALGKVKIYTLQYFLHRLKIGDLECYEILYTKYRIVNPKYSDTFQKFIISFSQSMNYERIKCSLVKKLNEHLLTLFWTGVSPNNERYNKKRLYWAIRVYNQLNRIEQGEDFQSSLIYRSDEIDDLMQIKSIPNYLSISRFNEIYKKLISFITSYQLKVEQVYHQETEKEKLCLSEFSIQMAQFAGYKGGNK